MSEESKRRELLDILVEHVGVSLPGGFDSWGFKTVDALRRTHNGFTWPAVGGVARSWDEGVVHAREGDPCPAGGGDGLCVAKTPRGASSGGLPLGGLLLVAYRSADVAGATLNKLRVRGDVYVVGEELIGRLNLYNADLRGANLSNANLRYADLRYADLYSANLYSADLYSANLSSADLYSADLSNADLYSANLSSADLSSANLSSADLSNADLRGALGVTDDMRGRANV